MKKDIHPDYHPVVFVDPSVGAEFVTRSTMKSGEVRDIDGVDHFEFSLDHGYKYHLRNAVTGFDGEAVLATVPDRNKHLSLVV